MKKISVLVAIIFTLTLLLSCGRLPDGETTPAETTQQVEINSSTASDNEEDTTAEVEIETESETETEEFPKVLPNPTAYYFEGGDGFSEEFSPWIIRTEDEFKAYIEKADHRFVSKSEVQAAIQRFDEAFWEKHDLVMVSFVAGSASYRYKVSSMTRDEIPHGYNTKSEGVDWFVNLENVFFGAATLDMKAWEFWIEVPEGAVKENDVIGLSLKK